MYERGAFDRLSQEEVAALVAAKRMVCAFPINGTRRWYLLEQQGKAAAPESESAYLRDYFRATGQRQAELARLFFEHGVYALITPVFGASLFQRGGEYVSVALQQGLGMLADDPAYVRLFSELDVRVRFYGDYRRQFEELGLARALATLEEVTEATAGNEEHLWLLGVCADDPVATVAELAIRFGQEHGRAPDRAELIAAYYGVPLAALDLFVGYDTPSVFDIPLLDMNQADLYFTVRPSPYLDARLLRAILYDHLYARRVPEVDYTEATPEGFAALRAFYDANRDAALGLGRRFGEGWFWYPTPQVRLPRGFER